MYASTLACFVPTAFNDRVHDTSKYLYLRASLRYILTFLGGWGGGKVKLSKNMMWENGVTERETPGREWTWWRFKQSIKMWGSPRNNTCTSVYLHPLKISEVKFTYPGQHPHIPSVPLLFLGGTENGNGKIRLDKTRAVRLRKRTKYTFRGTTTVLSALSEIAQILVERFTPTGLYRTFS